MVGVLDDALWIGIKFICQKKGGLNYSQVIQSSHQYIQANSFDVFPIEDDSVNLVVTSPPYPMVEMWDEIFGRYDATIGPSIGIGAGYLAYEAMHQLLDQTWKECFRVLKNGGFACINIGDATRTLDTRFQMYSNHSRILQACAAIGFDILPSIIWRKPTNSPTKFMGSGMLPGGAYVTLEHEWILILRKGTKRVFDKDAQTERRNSAMFWEERNKWFCDQWFDILGTGQKMKKGSSRNRSGAYPFEIPYRLISMYSKYGDVVLDPFSGTGTSALASILAGRSSKNIDADEYLLNESMLVPTKRTTKGELNSNLSERLKAHVQYVSSKDMLYFKYRNPWMNTPVKTRQEKEMRLYPIKSISRANNVVEVKYRKWKGEELASFIS
jgi:DNA modification methylase